MAQDALKVFQESLRDHGIVRRGDPMMSWLSSQSRVEEFVDFVGSGGSMKVYAENNGLSYTALVLYVNTAYEGRIRKLIDQARGEYRRQCAADVLDRNLLSESPDELTDGQKRMIDATVGLSKVEDAERTSAKAATNVTVKVSFATLHGKIQERRRVINGEFRALENEAPKIAPPIEVEDSDPYGLES